MSTLALAAVLVLGQYQYVYKTSFNTREWGAYQEIIDTCYSGDAGRVFIDGGQLFVAANWEDTVYNNHLIAQRSLSKTGMTSPSTRYAIEFYVDSNPADWLTYPEDGPEVSVQNTRFVDGGYQTATAGFQYAANPWGSPHWNVWTQTAPLSGAWFATTGTLPALQQWYVFETEIDYTTNTYKWARWCNTDGGSCNYLGVDGGQLGVNLKWGEEGYWITAEAQNIWQGTCTGVELTLPLTVRYDNVTLSY